LVSFYCGALSLSFWQIALTYFFGILQWTFLEYVLHRFVFHYQPQSRWGQRLHFFIHGVHHDYPRDATRLVLPLPASLPLAGFFYGLFQWAYGSYHDMIFSGLVSGYLAYDCLHYAFHHFAMKSPVANYLKAYHLKHHFIDPDTGYGVSTPLWDFVFRTSPLNDISVSIDDSGLPQTSRRAA
jgi:sterol desaturase/sphingolipid hydroxylase (fatty acid hydroxylase superfamily)